MRKQCAECPEMFEAKRPNAQYCSPRCRKRAQRNGHTEERAEARTIPMPSRPDDPAEDGPVTAATRAELAAAGREGSALGQAALAAARRIDTPTADSGSAIASLIREHRAARAEALDGVTGVVDPLDELRVRRDAKRHAG